ncbi:MAG: YcxB family protein [Myxococcota bacterium]
MTHEPASDTRLTVDVSLTPAHIEDALWLTLRKHTPGLRFMPLTFLFAAIAPFVIATMKMRGYALPVSAYIFSAACIAYLFAVPLGLRWLSRRGAKARTDALRFVFDEGGFSVDAANAVRRLNWNELYECASTRRVWVLYEKPSVFHVLPRGGEHGAALEAMLLAHVPPKRRMRDVLGWLSPGAAVLLMLLVATAYVLWSTPR